MCGFEMTRIVSLLGLCLITSLCSAAAAPLAYQVLDSRPHDAGLFTQGLEIHAGWLYASGGLYRQSRIGKYHLDAATPARSRRLPDHLFAEGITLLRGRLFLLTWKAGQARVYDPENLQLIQTFRYSGEGWGLTHNGRQLIMSNGSEQLVFRNPDTFQPERRLSVVDGTRRRRGLNELEYAEGFIWANIWLRDSIVKIDPADGRVVAEADLSQLRRRAVKPDHHNVLNGIAYDREKKAFWVTGKLWPRRYLIEFVSYD